MYWTSCFSKNSTSGSRTLTMFRGLRLPNLPEKRERSWVETMLYRRARAKMPEGTDLYSQPVKVSRSLNYRTWKKDIMWIDHSKSRSLNQALPSTNPAKRAKDVILISAIQSITWNRMTQDLKALRKASKARRLNHKLSRSYKNMPKKSRRKNNIWQTYICSLSNMTIS